MGLGFSSTNATIVATAISELARDIVLYAKHAEIILNVVRRDDRAALIVSARDQGVGIADLARAMHDGYSTSGVSASVCLASGGSWTSSKSSPRSVRAQSSRSQSGSTTRAPHARRSVRRKPTRHKARRAVALDNSVKPQE